VRPSSHKSAADASAADTAYGGPSPVLDPFPLRQQYVIEGKALQMIENLRFSRAAACGPMLGGQG
jgi:hypothetical protein